MPINMHNMARAGFDHIVTKPFKVAEFVDMLRGTLRTAAWPPGEEAHGAAPS